MGIFIISIFHRDCNGRNIWEGFIFSASSNLTHPKDTLCVEFLTVTSFWPHYCLRRVQGRGPGRNCLVRLPVRKGITWNGTTKETDVKFSCSRWKSCEICVFNNQSSVALKSSGMPRQIKVFLRMIRWALCQVRWTPVSAACVCSGFVTTWLTSFNPILNNVKVVCLCNYWA